MRNSIKTFFAIVLFIACVAAAANWAVNKMENEQTLWEERASISLTVSADKN